VSCSVEELEREVEAIENELIMASWERTVFGGAFLPDDVLRAKTDRLRHLRRQRFQAAAASQLCRAGRRRVDL
jgi:hypothetical protein